MGSSATNQSLLKLNYDYGTTDNNGNVKSQQITVPTVGANTGFTAVQTYTYDSLNRLKDAKEMIGTTQTWKQTFTFDRFGNRNFDTANTTTLGSCPVNVCNPSINPVNNRFNSGQGYTYDLAGNIISDAQGRTFTYDAENKQKEVRDVNNSVVGQYFYDGDGKRVKKFIFNTQETTLFVYDASGKMVAEYSTTVAPVAEAKVSYLTTDHLGSPRITTDANGQVISRRDFLPFGEELTSAYTAQRNINLHYGQDAVRQKFTSYERDIETDLDFAQARYYKPSHGRFTSVDPIMMAKKRLADPQAINLYVYTRNNPLKYVDPDGEEFKGTDDKKVIIKREKVNGKKVWVIKSNNASKDLQKLVGLVNASGSKTASSQFGRLNNHATMINIVIDTTTTGGTRLGLHEAHDKNGPVNFNSKNEKFDRPSDAAVDAKGNVIEGAYREATITLFQKEYEDRGITGDALDAQLVGTFAHESRHDLDPKQVQAGITGTGSDAIWHPKTTDGKDAKRSPRWYQDKVLREIKKAGSKRP